MSNKMIKVREYLRRVRRAVFFRKWDGEVI